MSNYIEKLTKINGSIVSEPMQYCYIMIKPGFLKYADEIITELKNATHSHILMQAQYRLTTEQCDDHYAHCVGKPFYEGMLGYMLSGDVIGAVLMRKGGDLTADARANLLPMREKYMELTGRTIRYENGIHCSDSDMNGKIEANRFKQEVNLNIDFEVQDDKLTELEVVS
jgi:nucleoside diphosphate kinase